MTKIPKGKTVVRQTEAYDHAAPLIVTLHSGHVTVRRKGERTDYGFTYGALFDLAKKMNRYKDRKAS